MWVKGRIIDETTKKHVPYAQIASYGMFSLFSADSLGRFALLLPSNDSIRIIALGFAPTAINLSQLGEAEAQNLTIAISQTAYAINEVNVYKQSANEHLQKFMPSDIKMGYVNPTPVGLRSEIGGKPSAISVLFRPLSFMQYHFGKREKQMERAREALAAEKAQSRMTKKLVGELTSLKAQELDDFFVYCNANIKVSAKDTDSYIRSRVLDAYQVYKNKPKIQPQDETVKD